MQLLVSISRILLEDANITSAFPPARYLAPLCHQIWATEEMLPQIKDLPILFLSGLKDEIVPPTNETVSQVFARLSAYRDAMDGPQVWPAPQSLSVGCCDVL